MLNISKYNNLCINMVISSSQIKMNMYCAYLRQPPSETLHSSHFTWTLELVSFFLALICLPAPPFQFTFDARGEDIPAMRCECDCDCQCHAMNALIMRLMLTVSMCRVMGRHTNTRKGWATAIASVCRAKRVRKTPCSIQCFVSSQSKITHLVALTRTHTLL